jgi:hypothetical protein
VLKNARTLAALTERNPAPVKKKAQMGKNIFF